MKRIVVGICLLVSMIVAGILHARADYLFDGEWKNDKPTSSKAPCRLGKITLNVRNHMVTGEAATIQMTVQDYADSNRAQAVLMEAGAENITVRTMKVSKGDGSVEAQGGIAIEGSITEANNVPGAFSGTLAGHSFTGQFSADHFLGSVDLITCQVKVSAKRKR